MVRTGLARHERAGRLVSTSERQQTIDDSDDGDRGDGVVADPLAPPPDGFQQGRDWYADPTTGLVVMTEHFLRSRGWCCRNGCRHCPWDHDGPGRSAS